MSPDKAVIEVGITNSEEQTPGGSDGKKSACNAGDPDLIPGSGRSPGEEKGYTHQYSGLENSTDRGAWPTAVYGLAELERVRHD